MSIPGSGSPLLLATTAAAAADAGYVIPKSLRFNSGDSSFLSKTFASAGNRKTWTWSAWLKRTGIGTTNKLFGNEDSSEYNGTVIQIASDKLAVYDITGSTQWIKTTTQVFRDPSAWYHIVVAVDTTDGTAEDRVKIYVNGIRVTSFSSSTNPSQNADTQLNDTTAHGIGRSGAYNSSYLNGYLADVQFVDGQALAPTDFGETRSSDGVWVPKEFADSGPNSGIEWSSNSTNFTNPGQGFNGNSGDYAEVSSSGAKGTFTFPSSITVANNVTFAFSSGTSGNLFVNDSSTAMQGTSFQVQTISFTGTLTKVSLQSSSQPVLYYLAVDGVPLIDNANHNYGRNGFHLNFSDSSTNEALGFDFAPTTPDPDPKKGMDVITYTGNGGTQNIGGLGFEPALIWCKTRSHAVDHKLVDSVRGVTNVLEPNQNRADSTGITNGITAINPDGFALGNSGDFNSSGRTYVAWTWRAGGPAVTNTDGSIDAEVSANTDYGFSIAKYTVGTNTSQTIGHGLTNQTPKFIIVKETNQVNNWQVYHASAGNTKYLYLNSSAAAATNNLWDNTSPTTSVFTIRSGGSANFYDGKTQIAYCWSEVSGFSKFGSYSGSSSDVTVTTGFKPRYILIKCTDTAGQEWIIKDSERGGDKYLQANDSSAEATGRDVTFNSDGFTLAHTQGPTNFTGRNYVYAAFADRPGNNWDVNNIVTNEGLTTSKTQFDVVTYTGTGSTQSIDSLAFQPDFVWIKGRDWAGHHSFTDSVRGATKVVYSNLSGAEATNTGMLSAFNSDGFTVGSDNDVNKSGQKYVAWAWKAGGTAVSNTDGSITSSVSANAEYGFSIVSYTGTGSTATVGHGLSSTPKWVLVKPRSASGSWQTFHVGIGNTGSTHLNSTAGVDTASSYWNNTDPTSSVFTVGSSNTVNQSGTTFIAYCFANVPGYQRIGSYTGNGSSTGPVIVTGFKPRFLIIKQTDGQNGWFMWDSERDSTNPNDALFSANASNVEQSQSNHSINFLDNGFQPDDSNGAFNGSGNSYIYIAIGDDEIGSDEDCLVDVPNAVTADADATDTTGGYQRGNYCTPNPLSANSNVGFSDGNLNLNSTVGGWYSCTSTIGISSGKFYWEATAENNSSDALNSLQIGIAPADSDVLGSNAGSVSNGYAYVQSNGNKMSNGTQTSYASSASRGDTVMVAFDADNGKIWWGKNGTWFASGDPAAGTNAAYTSIASDTYIPVFSFDRGRWLANFGQMRFKYRMPSGYAALNTTALPDATIEDGSTAMDVVTYTGTITDTSSQTVTGLSFESDLVWIKRRDGANSHQLVDSVRGTGRWLESNSGGGENTSNTNGVLTAFNSDGFTLTGGSTNANLCCESGFSYVAWAWDAGSSTVSNTDGSLTSSVRANASAGFSIVKYTSGSGSQNDTVGHGLNAVPELILLKRLGSDPFVVSHKALSTGQYLELNSLSTIQSSANCFPTAHTNSVFGIGTDGRVNAGGNSYIAYCFTSVSGYSQIGSFEGNGSANGPFVYLGFRPAFLLIRLIEGANSSWKLYDSSRDPDNPVVKQLYANSTDAEPSDDTRCDLLSNGFKVRTAGSEDNYNNNTLIYYAVAENPFQANGGLAR